MVTDAGGTIDIRLATRRPAYRRFPPADRAQFNTAPVRRASPLVAVLALAGVVIPSEVQISLADGLRFAPGRIAATLLFLPALFALCRKDRRFILCDFLAFATTAWMIVASLISVGGSALSAAGGDALDFLGGYLIARGFVFGRPALDTFIRVLKLFAVTAIIFGMADRISGRLIVHETFAAIVHASNWPEAGFRNGTVRAASTFDHEIAFGVFCALNAAIFLYWERRLLPRILAAGLCLWGAMLAISSAALMAVAMIFGAYTYDRLLKRYSWRWGAFWMVTGTASLGFFVLSPDPLSWVLSHLTLDPQTGYYRIAIWEAAADYIARSPMIGYAYEPFNNMFLISVDSIWLLQVLRFGIPMFILFFLTNITAFFPGRRESVNGANDVYIDRMRRAFTLVVLMFMFSGFTVHFWNYMLMFWGLCLGIRASLRELSIGMAGRIIHQKANI
jgi:hypothetical protein